MTIIYDTNILIIIAKNQYFYKIRNYNLIVMKVFDRFILGDTENIDWCFENTHFNQRLSDNGIKRQYIVDTVMYEEPLRYEKSGNEEYEVIYEAPANKDYKEIKLIFACHGNTIDLVTIMPNFQTATNRQKKKYQSDKRKDIDKKRHLELIVSLARENKFISKADVVKLLHVDDNRAAYLIRKLVAQKVLEPVQKGRYANYRLVK